MVTACLTATLRCSRVMIVKMIVATVALAVIAPTTTAVAPVVPVVVKAVTSPLLALTPVQVPSAFARQHLLPKRKENKHVAT